MELFSLTNAELFEDLIMASDSHLNTVMGKVTRGEFGSGDVTIKINLSCADEEVEVARSGSDFEVMRYKRPVIKFSVRSNLKQSFADEDSILTEGYMVDDSNGVVRFAKVNSNQMSMLGDEYD